MTSANFTIGKFRESNIYLYHPVIDLLLVCGGWLLALASINYFFTATSVNAVISAVNITSPDGATFDLVKIIVLIGTYALSQPHSAATLFRLYGEKSQRENHKFVAYLLPLLLGCLLLLALRFPILARLEATLYIVFAIHHIIAQCYGVTLMYCVRAKMRLSSFERYLLKGIVGATTTAAVCQQLSSDWPTHKFLDLNLFQFPFFSAPLIVLLQIAIALMLAAMIVLQIHRFGKHEIAMPAPAVLTMLTAIALLTIWNGANDFIWIFVPAFFHASQYLAVSMSSFLKQEEAELAVDHLSRSAKFEFIITRWAELFVVGLLLFIAIPKLLSLTGAPFQTSVALVFFAISLHHFAADSCIWKLRDANVKKNTDLISARDASCASLF